MIEKIGYDLVLAVVSAILGALFGVLIPKLLKMKRKQLTFKLINNLFFANPY